MPEGSHQKSAAGSTAPHRKHHQQNDDEKQKHEGMLLQELDHPFSQPSHEILRLVHKALRDISDLIGCLLFRHPGRRMLEFLLHPFLLYEPTGRTGIFCCFTGISIGRSCVLAKLPAGTGIISGIRTRGRICIGCLYSIALDGP